jgi:Zn-dependent peptidase ImmA (M78 family)
MERGKIMSIQSARRQAESLIASLGITQAPVPVEDVAKHLGLRVISMDLDEDISGLLITKPDMSCIVVRKSDGVSRKRFSIAHEVGHFVLRHQFEAGGHVHVDRGYRVSHRDKRSSAGTDLREIEANQFAAALLMPSPLVTETIRALGREELNDEDVTNLARQFNVSEQAMTIRLSVLGQIS